MLRLARRRTDRGAGGPLQRPQQLREIFRPSRRGAWPRPSRTARSGPTSSTTSPTARDISRPRRRRSGTRLAGKVDGFICAVGTGGTLGGVSMGLKDHNKDVVIGARRSRRAPRSTITTSTASSSPKAARSPRASARAASPPISKARWSIRPTRSPTPKRFPIIFDLLSEEGLCLGGSSGINVAGAIRLARELGPGHTIVTVLCDYGTRYQSRLFNPEFLREKGLPVPQWLDLRQEAPPRVFV